jgi:hypothetical protein
MLRDHPATLPFVSPRPQPQPRRDARRIIEISLPPSEFARTVILACDGSAEIVALLDVQVLMTVTPSASASAPAPAPRPDPAG